jgi:hypothetical protein
LGQFDNELLNIEADEPAPAFSQEEDQADFSQWNQTMSSREISLNFGNVIWSRTLSYDGQIATALDEARTLYFASASASAPDPAAKRLDVSSQFQEGKSAASALSKSKLILPTPFTSQFKA